MKAYKQATFGDKEKQKAQLDEQIESENDGMNSFEAELNETKEFIKMNKIC